MTRRTLFAGGSLACLRQLLRAETLNLAPTPMSEVVLEVRKTGLMAGRTHRLEFPAYVGSVTEGSTPTVVFAVQAKRLICKDDWLSAKDREKVRQYAIDKLLEAETYPTLSYASTAVRQTGLSYVIDGNLTIKNRTRPLPVSVRTLSGPSRGWSGQATIRLTDFGLKPPTAALGAVGTEDALQLRFRLYAQQV